MLHLRICIVMFMVLYFETILSEGQYDKLYHYISLADAHTSRTGRFGFYELNELRKQFCHSFCKSADTMPYIVNLVCAAKCPELYLPHSTSIKPTTSTTTSTMKPTNQNPPQVNTMQPNVPQLNSSQTSVKPTTTSITTMSISTMKPTNPNPPQGNTTQP